MPTTPLSFAPGETSKTITVWVQGDTVVENTEVFSVMLSNVTNAIGGIFPGQGTILDNDLFLSGFSAPAEWATNQVLAAADRSDSLPTTALPMPATPSGLEMIDLWFSDPARGSRSKHRMGGDLGGAELGSHGEDAGDPEAYWQAKSRIQ